MRNGIYAIYDRASNDVGPLFEAKTLKVALRNYKMLVEKTQFPGDFELYRLGFIDRTEDEKTHVVSTKLTDIFEIVGLPDDVSGELEAENPKLKILKGGKIDE